MSRRSHWAISLLIMLVLLMGGCSSINQTLGLKKEPPAPKYYDFTDVLVPAELSLDRAESVVYEFGAFKAGLLRFTGRVEVGSLVTFFRENMPRDGWTLVNSVKSSRVLLNFAKADRTCQMSIREKTLTTEVEIWVHPLKPRGT